jgi:uncharacterized protein (DUF2062 family)/SAM-dependent methyltransferase
MLGGLRRRLHELARAVWKQHTSPGRVGLAIVVGCTIGATPLFGLHLPICILFALLFGLNQVIVYGAAHISVPPLVPILGFFSVQLGERLLHGRWASVARGDFSGASVHALAGRFFVDWLVGGAILGAAVGLVAGVTVYAILRRRRARLGADPIEAAILAATRRYRGLPRKLAIYARMKYQMDPSYRAVARRVGPGAFTVDLGTGLGMLPVLLGELGEGRRALGVEWDGEKARAGARAAAGLEGIEVVEGDARSFDLPACDVVTLVDVLHYYDAETQRALLARCRAALVPGGRLLVREADPARRGGARFTRFLERLVTRLGWNRGPGVRFRPVPELRADLEALGFAVAIDEVAGRLHPGNVLLVAEVATAASEAAPLNDASSDRPSAG